MRNVNEFFNEFFNDSDIIAEAHNGDEMAIISKSNNEKIVLIYALSKTITKEDEEKIYESMIFFDILGDCMNYLRNVRLDHAINYDIKNLSVLLLGELYKNKKVQIKDILSV